MKQFTLTLAILCAFSALTFAGTQPSGKDKEVMQPAPPPCDWYRANEWNLNIWGTYAFPGNQGNPSILTEDIFDSGTDANVDEHIDVGPAHNDRFINRDGAWGGGADIKYFFNKYLGAGVEGFVIDCNDNAGGGGVFTFTFRYPIGCSRFAPYAWAGIGALGGGSHTTRYFNEEHFANREIDEQEFFSNKTIENKRTETLGQFGTGLEIRLLHPSEKCKIGVGLMADFAWNIADGGNNNFGMARFGLNFNY